MTFSLNRYLVTNSLNSNRLLARLTAQRMTVRLGVMCANRTADERTLGGPAVGVAEDGSAAAEEARQCVRCGLCLSVCPGYRESLKETDSPRARVALVQALEEGLIEAPAEGYANAFYRCLLCGACSFTCPSGVAVDRVLELTRGDLADEGSAAPGTVRPG